MRRLLALSLLLVLFPTALFAQENPLQAVLDEWADPNGAAIAVQITIGEESWSAAQGFADGTTPATPADQFRIGSVSKTFVSVLALQLAEEGYFSLDDLAADYLPAEIVENIANADQATIGQLLRMRSGIPDYLATDEFWAAISENPAKNWTAAEALTYAYGWDASFAPDEAYEYSNSNYLLAQLIIENVTGQSLHELVRAYILEPVGMANTYTQGQEEGGLVYGYEDFDGDGTPEDVTAINDGWGLGDGALISTVGDLTLFYQALLQEESLLSEEAMALLVDFGDDGEGGSYSYGLTSYDTDYGTAIGHDGAVSGFLSSAYYYTDEDAIVVVLCASADCDTEGIATAALEVTLE